MVGPARRGLRGAAPSRRGAALVGALAVVLLVLVGVLGACSSTGGATATEATATSVDRADAVPGTGVADPAAGPGLVAVVGDSITERGQAVLVDVLGPTWPLAIDGRSGYRVAEQQPAAEELARQDPSQVVVNLGSNDVLQGADLERAAAELRTMIATFPRAACIHLVTINEHMVSGLGSRTDAAVELNAAIASIAAEDPRIDLVDWAAAVEQDEAGSDGPLVPDTIHPSRRGQLLLAGLYADALAGCPAPAQQ